MLKCSVRGQDGVVRLHDGVGVRGGRVHAEFQLGLLTVVGGKTFQDQSTKAGTSSATERVEDEETLQTRTVVRQSANFVHDKIDLLLSNRVVTTGI